MQIADSVSSVSDFSGFFVNRNRSGFRRFRFGFRFLVRCAAFLSLAFGTRLRGSADRLRGFVTRVRGFRTRVRGFGILWVLGFEVFGLAFEVLGLVSELLGLVSEVFGSRRPLGRSRCSASRGREVYLLPLLSSRLDPSATLRAKVP